jgi:ABC-type transport system involved in multi-copper enzyme maturation permease subunit
MFAAREAGLVASREIRRNLRSRKGIAIFSLFLLGGSIPVMLQLFFTKLEVSIGGTASRGASESGRQLRRMLLERAYNAEIADYLVDCPSALLFLLRGTLFFLPLLILLIGFDQIAGEVQHRSIRYLAGRAHRGSIVVGKALGTWAVIATMVLVLHLVVWVMTAVRGEAPAGAIASWGARFWLFSVAQAAAYAGLTTLVSSLFRTPNVALFSGAALVFSLGLANTIFGLIAATAPLTWAFPGTYEGLLVSPDPLRVVGGIALLVLWGGACVAAAAEITRRRDI